MSSLESGLIWTRLVLKEYISTYEWEEQRVQAVSAREDHVGVARQNADIQTEQDQVADSWGGHHPHVAPADLHVAVGHIATDSDLQIQIVSKS